MVSSHALSSPRFGGYRPLTEHSVELYLPGASNAQQVEAEWITPDGNRLRQTLNRDNRDYWKLSQPIPKGSDYRIWVDGQPHLDWLEVKNRNTENWNHVENRAGLPKIHGAMLDVFQHSLKLDKPDSNRLSLEQINHFNQTQPCEAALFDLIKNLPTGSIRNLLLRPFQAGGYWTVNPYLLDPSVFTSKAKLREFLDLLRQKGIRPYMDVALVNQGLQGPQYLSNLHHGFRSPYWEWFVPTEAKAPGDFPRNAYDGFKLGVIPEKQLKTPWERVNLHLVNSPQDADYDPNKLTEVALSDPWPSSRDQTSNDTVQPYHFPVKPEEAVQKLKQASAQGLKPTDTAYKQLLTQWSNFSLVAPRLDDSGYKWDGMIDVAKLDIDNPDVRKYLSGAVTYWTRFMTQHQIEEIAKALKQAKAEQPDLLRQPTDWVTAIEGKGFAAMPDRQPIVWHPNPSHSVDALNPQTLSNRLLDLSPLIAVQTDWPVQAILSHPDFANMLRQQSSLLAAANHLLQLGLSPLKLLPGGQKIQDLLRFDSFSAQLQHQLQKAVSTLSPSEQQTLASPEVQELVLARVGEALWEKLIPPNSQALPPTLQHVDPYIGVVWMAHHLNRQLKQLDPHWLSEQLSSRIKPLDADSVSLAKAMVTQYELGPNLRIDAAKDVADMSRVRTASDAERPAVFEQEVKKSTDFWREILAPAKSIYPPMSVIAELTDIKKLSGNQETAQKAYDNFLSVFTSLPDVDLMFGLPYQMVHHSPTPHEFGDSQRPVTKDETGQEGFFNLMKTRSQSVPLTTQFQFQNMVASHDYPTAAHNLMVNPAISTQDRLAYWGLKNDLHQVRKELEGRLCFEALRAELKAAGVPDLGKSLYDLEEHAQAMADRKQLSFDVDTNFSEETKRQKNGIAPTPHSFKGQFTDELFKSLSPESLNLPDEAAKTVLLKAVRQRMQEASELRALRGVINNLWVKQLADYPEWRGLSPVLFNALDKTFQEQGTHFGFQPLDLVMDRWFDKLPDGDVKAFTPINETPAAFKNRLKLQLFQKALVPVTDKLLRVLAIQVGSPGLPSLYAHDLFPPSGSETTKNYYVQNRNPISLPENPELPGLQQYRNEALNLLKLRQQYPALDNGILLNPVGDEAQAKALNDKGILPLIRDNGQQQVLMLVNTGKPETANWFNRVGDGERYFSPRSTVGIQRNVKLNLKHLGFSTHTRYRDTFTGEIYLLNPQGELVRQDNHNQGIDISVYKLLVRE